MLRFSIAQLLISISSFICRPMELIIGNGLSKSIQCPASSNPPLTIIIWTKNLSIINQFNDNDRIFVSRAGELVFNPVFGNDSDIYTCSPYSPLFKQYTVITISILVKDIPSFMVRPLPYYHKMVGQSLTMPCVGRGDPEPKIYWKKVGSTFPSSTKTMYDGGNLTIVHLTQDEQGFYECYASNMVSTIVTTTILIVQGTYKEAPFNVAVVPSYGSARISWSPPYLEEGYSLSYRVWCQEQGSKEWSKFGNIPDFSFTTTIYNLKAVTKYRFVVVTQGKNKLKFSNEVYAITPNISIDERKSKRRRNGKKKYKGNFSLRKSKYDSVIKIKQGVVVSSSMDHHPPLHLGVIGVVLCLLGTAICSVIFYIRKLNNTVCSGNSKKDETAACQ